VVSSSNDRMNFSVKPIPNQTIIDDNFFVRTSLAEAFPSAKSMPAAWPSIFGSKNTQLKEDSAELVDSDPEQHPNATQERNVNELGEQNPDGPMSMGDMQDVMYFKFVMGKPMLNFILAVLWSIGLPILLYHLLRPKIGQIAGMIVASLPPLAIVVW
jgi:hypothetical protein